MLRARTGYQAVVRESKLSIILSVLQDHSPESRALLAMATSLNETNVPRLVQLLIDADLVSEIGARRTEETGQPGIFLKLNPRAGCLFGAEIGVDLISSIVNDFTAEYLRHHPEQIDTHSHESIISRTLELIKGVTEQTHTQCKAVLELGLGLPGVADVGPGTLLFAPDRGGATLQKPGAGAIH